MVCDLPLVVVRRKKKHINPRVYHAQNKMFFQGFCVLFSTHHENGGHKILDTNSNRVGFQLSFASFIRHSCPHISIYSYSLTL